MRQKQSPQLSPEGIQLLREVHEAWIERIMYRTPSRSLDSELEPGELRNALWELADYSFIELVPNGERKSFYKINNEEIQDYLNQQS